MHLLDLPAVVLAIAALLFLPGWLAMRAVAGRPVLDPMVRPAAALTVSLALLAPALALVLAVGASTWWCVAWTVALVAIAGMVAWRRRGPAPGGGAGRGMTVAGGLTVLVALLGGLLATWTGGDLRRDQVYHTARVVKLVELDAPTFASASRFEGGGATTPYAFPLWHGAQATVVQVSRVEPMLLAWLLPSLLVPISILVHAGLARELFGTPAAGLAAAIAWLAMRVLDYAPDYRFLTNAQWPGMVAALVVVPLVCAMLPAALDASRGGDRRRGALALGAIGTLVVVGLHANYVLFPALLVAGALAWLLAWDRTLRPRAMLGVCAAWGGAAALGLLALLPVLRDHAGPAAGGGVDALVRASRNANYFEQVGGGWVLGLEPLVGRPLTIFAFAAAAVMALAVPRLRATAFAAAGLAAVVACARIAPITEAVLGLGNLTAVTRLWLAAVAPTTVAFAGVLLLAWRAGARVRAREDVPRRWIVGVALAVAGLAWAALHPPSQAQDARMVATLALFGAVALGLVAGAASRVRGAPAATVEAEPVESRAWRPGRRTWIAGALAAAVALLAAPVVLDGRFDRAVHRDARLGEAFDAREQLRGATDPGDVVLADEQDSYVLPAVAPVYVVGDYKWWLERSEHVDTEERLDDVRRASAQGASDGERRAVRDRYGVDLVIDRSRDGRGERVGPWRISHG